MGLLLLEQKENDMLFIWYMEEGKRGEERGREGKRGEERRREEKRCEVQAWFLILYNITLKLRC
jgi:hypothetical protein